MILASHPIKESSAAGANFPPGVLRWEYTSAYDGHEDWAMLWPGAQTDTWAVVLHGHGATGDQIFTRADIRDLWLPAMRNHGLGILAPNLRGNAWMGPAAASDLHDLLAGVWARFGARRFIITGGSMGGSSALAYSAIYPGDVAACVAGCPATDIGRYANWCQPRQQQMPVLNQIRSAIVTSYGGEPDAQPALYARHSACANHDKLTMPVAIAHAQGDKTIPVDEARALAQLMSGQENFRYDEQPGGNHDSSLQLYVPLLDWAISRIAGG